jgi:hypothetical protein
LVVSFREEANATLPPEGEYATGIFFTDKESVEQAENIFTRLALDFQIEVRLSMFHMHVI